MAGLGYLFIKTGFVPVLNVFENTCHSPMLFQGLEILEKQYFSG